MSYQKIPAIVEDPYFGVEHRSLSHEDKTDIEPTCREKIAQAVKGMMVERRLAQPCLLKQAFSGSTEDVLAVRDGRWIASRSASSSVGLISS